MSTVTIKAGRVQPIWAGHPWVFAQAVERVVGGAVAGAEVDVVDPQGNHLGRGLYSPRSAIVVRLFTRGREHLDGALLRQRLVRAQRLRTDLGLPGPETDAFRWVYAEGDDLPGLIVDVYRDVAVVQLGSVGMHQRAGAIVDALMELARPRAVLNRTSSKVAEQEGFDLAHDVFVSADAELEALEFCELGLRYRLPRELGQKTGYYLDQRPLRARVRRLARGKERVLDAYSFVGSLALNAARGGAREVIAVDSSALALEVGAECAALNGLADRVQHERGDARHFLQEAGKSGGFDLVICDPPKLAPSRASLPKAQEAMRRLARDACRATRPGGYLVLCSCSAALGASELTRCLALGARDVGTEPTVLERVYQGADHPVPAAFPEGMYLSSVIARITPR